MTEKNEMSEIEKRMSEKTEKFKLEKKSFLSYIYIYIT